MEGSGAAKMIGPDLLQLAGFTEEDRLQHSRRVGVVPVQRIQPGDSRCAKGENRAKEWRPTASARRADCIRAARRDRPIYVAPSRVGDEIEGSRVVEVPNRAYLALQLDALAVVELRRRFSVANRQADPSSGARSEFHRELVPALEKDGRLDNAPSKDHGFA